MEPYFLNCRLLSLRLWTRHLSVKPRNVWCVFSSEGEFVFILLGRKRCWKSERRQRRTSSTIKFYDVREIKKLPVLSYAGSIPGLLLVKKTFLCREADTRDCSFDPRNRAKKAIFVCRSLILDCRPSTQTQNFYLCRAKGAKKKVYSFFRRNYWLCRVCVAAKSIRTPDAIFNVSPKILLIRAQFCPKRLSPVRLVATWWWLW